jgi:hypothetical protein
VHCFKIFRISFTTSDRGGGGWGQAGTLRARGATGIAAEGSESRKADKPDPEWWRQITRRPPFGYMILYSKTQVDVSRVHKITLRRYIISNYLGIVNTGKSQETNQRFPGQSPSPVRGWGNGLPGEHGFAEANQGVVNDPFAFRLARAEQAVDVHVDFWRQRGPWSRDGTPSCCQTFGNRPEW